MAEKQGLDLENDIFVKWLRCLFLSTLCVSKCYQNSPSSFSYSVFEVKGMNMKSYNIQLILGFSPRGSCVPAFSYCIFFIPSEFLQC